MLPRDRFYHADNVTEFNGYSVENGEVSMTDSQYEAQLNEIYSEMVTVCGQTYEQGTAIYALDPVHFSHMKGEEESRMTDLLNEQLANEDLCGVELEDEDLEEEEDE